MRAKQSRRFTYDDIEFCHVTFEVVRTIVESSDPMDFITDIKGKITIYNDDTEQSDIVVATCEAMRIEVINILEAKRSVREVFHSYDGELDMIFESLFVERGFNPQLEKITEPGMGDDVLVITRVEVAQRYRGWNLGQVLALSTKEQFSNFCKYVALIASPLQFSGRAPTSKDEIRRLGYDKFAKDEATATTKVANLWKAIGFSPVEAGSDVFIASPVLVPPKTIKQLFREAAAKQEKSSSLRQKAARPSGAKKTPKINKKPSKSKWPSFRRPESS